MALKAASGRLELWSRRDTLLQVVEKARRKSAVEECRCPKCGNIVKCLEGPPPGILKCSSCGASTEVAPDAPLIGRVIGGHHIIRKIGAGGVGTVYLATQLSLRRRVAFKALKADLIDDPQALDVFRNEAISAARLNHPNVVHIHDIAADQGVTYLTMEFVNGVSLRQLIAGEGQMSPSTAVGFAKQMLLALAEAHRQHLIHRDVKPENVLMGDDGLAKVADFGLAGALIRNETARLDMGTPHYMSPEHARGEALDLRTDIYSVGATLYHMITGQPPYKGETVQEVLDRLKTEAAIPIADLNPMAPPDLVAIVEKMMAHERSARYQSAEEALRALEMFEISQGLNSSPSVSPNRSGTLRSVAAAETTRAGLMRSRGERQRRGNGTLIFVVPAIALAVAGMAFLLILSPESGTNGQTPIPKTDIRALTRATNIYNTAVLYADEHPEDYAGIIDRFEQVARETANTPIQSKALHELTAAQRTLDEKAIPAYGTLKTRAEALKKEGRFQEAVRVFDEFPLDFLNSAWRETINKLVASYTDEGNNRARDLRVQVQQAIAEGRYDEAAALCKDMEHIGFPNIVRDAQRDLSRIPQARKPANKT